MIFVELAIGASDMVERAIELRRRTARKKKMAKLKSKLITAGVEDRDKVLLKIHRLSPWWKEPLVVPAAEAAAPAKKAKKA